MSRVVVTLLVAISLAGCGLRASPSATPGALPTTNLLVGRAALTVEVADSDAERQQGLSGRESLPENGGMLFVFSEASRHEFWMKDMRFALDFLWLANGKVVELTLNVPPPSAAAPEPVRIRPGQPADMVIEVLAGWAAANRVATGDQVTGLPARVDR